VIDSGFSSDEDNGLSSDEHKIKSRSLIDGGNIVRDGEKRSKIEIKTFLKHSRF